MYQTYLARPVVGITTGLALGRRLQVTARPGLSAGADETFAYVVSSHAALGAAWKRQQARVTDDKRPLYLDVCAIWTACVGRVEHYKALNPSRFPLQPAAVRLHGLLAPDGMEALKLPYPDLWTTLTTRLEVITEERLEDRFRTIAGVEFVTETTVALDTLGRALGLVVALEAAPEDNLRELLREFMQCVSDYAFQVMATVRRGKPATLKVALAVLKPLDEMRAAMPRRNSAESDATEETDAIEETDTTPSPVTQPVETPVVVSRPSLPAPSRPSVPPQG